MSKMNELYEKVAASSTLQEKFAEIIKNAEVAGEEATKEKMVDFAKEAGYDITVDELQKFFKGLVESEEGALSDVELDQVAGGKSTGSILITLVGPVTCGFASVVGAMNNNVSCGKVIDTILDIEM